MLENNYEPALNNITAPFLYMFNNDYIVDNEENNLATEDIINKFNKVRLNSMSKNFDLFTPENIIQFPPDKPTNELDPGQLYSLSIKEYVDRIATKTAEAYEHFLFVDITRDGMRLVVPIYKLFTYEDDTLLFNILNISGLIPRIEVHINDKFLFMEGETLRIAMRHLKKNSLLKNRAKLEHAGISSKFSADQI